MVGGLGCIGKETTLLQADASACVLGLTNVLLFASAIFIFLYEAKIPLSFYHLFVFLQRTLTFWVYTLSRKALRIGFVVYSAYFFIRFQLLAPHLHLTPLILPPSKVTFNADSHPSTLQANMESHSSLKA